MFAIFTLADGFGTGALSWNNWNHKYVCFFENFLIRSGEKMPREGHEF